MSETCVFCAIARGEVAADVVWRDDIAVAFLDRSPLFHGHTLVVPRRHVLTLPDLLADEVGPFFERVRMVAAAMPSALGASRTCTSTWCRGRAATDYAGSSGRVIGTRTERPPRSRKPCGVSWMRNRRTEPLYRRESPHPYRCICNNNDACNSTVLVGVMTSARGSQRAALSRLVHS